MNSLSLLVIYGSKNQKVKVPNIYQLPIKEIKATGIIKMHFTLRSAFFLL